MVDLISTEPCPCGHSSCTRTFLVGIGIFFQGSGFTPEEAQEICTAVNSRRRARAAAAAARAARARPEHVNTYVETDGRRYRVLSHRSGRVMGIYLGSRYIDPEGRRGRQILSHMQGEMPV